MCKTSKFNYDWLIREFVKSKIKSIFFNKIDFQMLLQLKAIRIKHHFENQMFSKYWLMKIISKHKIKIKFFQIKKKCF